MTDQELLEQIRQHRLADLSDGMDAIGLVGTGVMQPQMQAITSGVRMAGFAYTIKYVPSQITVQAATNWDEYYNQLVHLSPWASGFTDESAKDKVFVVDAMGLPAGVWGSENTLKAMTNGAAGIVIDGACRDVYEVRLQKMKVWSTARTCNHIYGRLALGGINVPIECAGVAVFPGDIVCADDDGVLVIPRQRAEAVLSFARMIHEKDQKDRGLLYKELGWEADETLGKVDPKQL